MEMGGGLADKLIYDYAPQGVVRTDSFQWGDGYVARSNCMYKGDNGYYVAGAFMEGAPSGFFSSDMWLTTIQGDVTHSGWIEIELPKPMKCTRIAWLDRANSTPHIATYTPFRMELHGSNDNVNYALLMEQSYSESPLTDENGFVNISFENIRKFKTYRLTCHGVFYDRVGIGRLRLYK